MSMVLRLIDKSNAKSGYPTVASLSGAAGRLKKPLSWQEIQQIAFEDRIKAKYEHE